MSRRFGIGIEPIEGVTDRRYHLTVAVYDTLDEMRRAAARYDREHRDGLADAGACFQIAGRVQNGGNRLGIMRLAEECLTPWVVIHEAVHVGVALAFAEHNRGRTKRQPPQWLHLDPYLGGGWAEREELIAYGSHSFAFGLLAELGLIDAPTDQEMTP